jgi:cytochrome c
MQADSGPCLSKAAFGLALRRSVNARDSPLTGGAKNAIEQCLEARSISGAPAGAIPEARITTRRIQMKFALVAAVGLIASTGAALAQDVAAGETSFRKCAPCHSIGPDAANKVGPELNGLDGRKSGSVDGFNYSDANKASGITWSEAVFREYIKDPRAKVPGTKMVFAGIKSEKEVGDLWSYVSQFDKDGNVKK